MITADAIKRAIKDLKKDGETVLKDPGQRGAGRLMIRIRANRAQWFALTYKGKKPIKAALGNYPDLGVLAARAKFEADFKPSIISGEMRPGEYRSRVQALKRERESGHDLTVQALFEAYIDSLEARGARAARQTRYYLLGSGKPGGESVVACIGPDKLASDVTPDDVWPFLEIMLERGAARGAMQVRGVISAVFNFGMGKHKKRTSFRPANTWGIKVNPAAELPTIDGAKRVGERVLSPAELHHFWDWLTEEGSRSQSARMLQLQIACGQRVEELLKATNDPATVRTFRERFPKGNGGALGLYDASERTLFWSTTKNNQPHLIPLPPQAVAILDALPPNPCGLYFPGRRPDVVMTQHGPLQLVSKYLKAYPAMYPGVAQRFTPRDLRRTWMTLAGAAGLSLEIRERLMNHLLPGIGSSTYDKWAYLEAKREAMATWGAFLARILAGEMDVAANVTTLRRKAA